jgi:hypothetical protein
MLLVVAGQGARLEEPSGDKPSPWSNGWSYLWSLAHQMPHIGNECSTSYVFLLLFVPPWGLTPNPEVR